MITFVNLCAFVQSCIYKGRLCDEKIPPKTRTKTTPRLQRLTMPSRRSTHAYLLTTLLPTLFAVCTIKALKLEENMRNYCQYFIIMIYVQVKINFVFELMRITSKTFTALSDPECLFQVLINTLAVDSASFLVGN